MRTRLLVLAAMPLLAACGTVPPAASGPAPGSTTTSEAATKQGFQPLKLGQEAGLGCEPGNPASCTVRFAVTAIDVNPACDPYRTPPPAGQKTVVLHVTMTTATPGQRERAQAGLLFSARQLKGVSPDGHITGVDYGLCLDRPGALSRDIVPNSKYDGFLEIAVDQTATSIATSLAGGDPATGWVWPLG